MDADSANAVEQRERQAEGAPPQTGTAELDGAGRRGDGPAPSWKHGEAITPEWPRLLGYPFPVRAAVRRRRGMLGMVIGVGLALGMVMTMMGILGTAMDSLVGDFGRSGANVFVAVNGGKLVVLKGGDNPGTIDRASAILSKIRGMPGVQGAVGVLSWPLKQEQEGPQARYLPAEFVPAMAVDGDPTQISDLVVLKEGRWLRRGNEVVLGPSLSGSKSLKVGDSLRMNGQQFEVVGIGRMRGFGATGESVAYVDARVLRQRGIIGDLANHIAVQTTVPATVISFVSDFPSLRAVESTELVREIKSSPDFSSATSTYWLIDLIILFIAGMFVTNMLGRSVAERRMEFGTMRAIGVPGRTILLSVAAEALLIILASFAFGVVVSLVLGTATNVLLAPAYNLPPMFGVDPATYFAILVVSIVMGLIAGFFPARSATRVDPLEVLREA